MAARAPPFKFRSPVLKERLSFSFKVPALTVVEPVKLLAELSNKLPV